MATVDHANSAILEIDCSIIYRHFSLPSRVTISPGNVECAFKKFLGVRVAPTQIVHQGQEIVVVHARLLPSASNDRRVDR